ncbi:MAG TPA: EamA family transporter [Chitinophagaceae bacterium]|nr:EamA family transporter [Chitinophagaceae bacterium]
MSEHAIRKGYYALIIISFFWGTTWFVSKLTIPFIPPLQMTSMRQTLAGIIMIGYFGLRKGHWPRPKQLIFHAIVGFLLISCSNGMTTWAISYIPSFLGALISCLMPFVLILANRILFGEQVQTRLYLALAVGFSGVSILLSSFAEEMKGDHFLFGIMLSLLSVFTWTGGTLISTKSKMNVNPYEGIGWQMLFGGIFLFIGSRITGQHVPLHTIPLKAWLLFLYLTAFGSIICFICYLYALKTLPMGLVSIYVYVNPIVAMLLGALFLDEKISTRIVLGIIVTFIGIFFVRRFSKTKPKVAEEEPAFIAD